MINYCPGFTTYSRSTRVILVWIITVLCGCSGSSTVPREPSKGRIAPEVIQAEIRRHYERFRVCYERGLTRDPKLSGKVQFQFVITPEGTVQGAVDAGSDLPDPEVVSCIVREVSTIKFPMPEGGNVTVTYPVMFAPR